MVGFLGGFIGVGTDIGKPLSKVAVNSCLTVIGGSIRVPSAFNFLYGIRPSHGRARDCS
jgi:amidase